MNHSSIPLVDLSIQVQEIWDDFQDDFSKLCQSGGFIGGNTVSSFESQFAQFMNVDHCIGVGNGGDALELALRAINVSFGDEVLVPANTFIATATAVSRVGATPIPVDVNESDFLIDISKIEACVSPRTKAIIPVHLFGQMADMDSILSIASRLNISVIEDAAQSQGATQNGISCGSFGTATATSFYPGKNLGAFGDGGAVLTCDPDLDKSIRMLRNYGGIEKYEHEKVGFNSRLDAIQALVLTHKLKHLHRWNTERQKAAELYTKILEGTPNIQLPKSNPGNSHVWHLYVVRVPQRDKVISLLNQMGIGAGIHYPKPFPELSAYSQNAGKYSECITASKLSHEILSLPIYPGITELQINQVCQALQQSLKSNDSN
jgi:dTDP-4-amino-4,6-dideoxygalactose transaminase